MWSSPELFSCLKKFRPLTAIAISLVLMYLVHLLHCHHVVPLHMHTRAHTQLGSSDPERGAFRVLTDTYVSAESGTGVVHQAPGFGEVSHVYGHVLNTSLRTGAEC